MALPPRDDGRADHRQQARHRRHVGRRLSAADGRRAALPRIVAREDPTMSAVTTAPFIVDKYVRFAHCDPAGIIFYPQYFVLAHDCKEDWFREAVGYPFENMVTRDRRGFPIVKLDAEFARPSRLGDLLQFEITVRAIGATSLKLDYRCVCESEERM